MPFWFKQAFLFCFVSLLAAEPLRNDLHAESVFQPAAQRANFLCGHNKILFRDNWCYLSNHNPLKACPGPITHLYRGWCGILNSLFGAKAQNELPAQARTHNGEPLPVTEERRLMCFS